MALGMWSSPSHFIFWRFRWQLKVALRNARAVAMIGGTLRSILRFGPSGAEVKGGSSTYRDAWCTIYASGFVHFSSEVSVDLELRYEKCYGICAASGFLFFCMVRWLSQVSLEF